MTRCYSLPRKIKKLFYATISLPSFRLFYLTAVFINVEEQVINEATLPARRFAILVAMSQERRTQSTGCLNSASFQTTCISSIWKLKHP